LCLASLLSVVYSSLLLSRFIFFQLSAALLDLHSFPTRRSSDLYILNLIFGIVLTGGALFFMWGGLIMVGMSWVVAIPLIPLLAWLIFYKFHMSFIAKKPFVSILVGLTFSILVFVAPVALLIFF